MNVLNDARAAKTFLILYEITSAPNTKAKKIAEKLDVTPQAISEYLKVMKKSGLVTSTNGTYVATQKGIQFLHERLLELKNFVDECQKKMATVDVCAALAKTPIIKGEPVGLFMEKGTLVAYANASSSSTGIALEGANAGEDVAVTRLEGIIAHTTGKLLILVAPAIEEGGSKAITKKKYDETLKEIKDFAPEKIGAGDVVAGVLAKKMGLNADFEFSSSGAAIEAAQRGFNVLLICSESECGKTLAALEKINKGAAGPIKSRVLKIT